MNIMQTIDEVASHLNILPGVIHFAIAKNELTVVDGKVDLPSAGKWIIDHNKLPAVSVWRRGFVKRFTPAEQVKIVSTPQGVVWWLMLMDFNRIDLNSLEIIGDVMELVIFNCITQQRALEILST